MLRSIVFALLLIPGPVLADSLEQAPTVEFTASEIASLNAMEESVPNEELAADEESSVVEEAAAPGTALTCEAPEREPTPLEIAKARARQKMRAAGSDESIYKEKAANRPQRTPSAAIDESYEMKGHKLFLIKPGRRAVSADFQIRFKQRPKARLKSN